MSVSARRPRSNTGPFASVLRDCQHFVTRRGASSTFYLGVVTFSPPINILVECAISHLLLISHSWHLVLVNNASFKAATSPRCSGVQAPPDESPVLSRWIFFSSTSSLHRVACSDGWVDLSLIPPIPVGPPPPPPPPTSPHSHMPSSLKNDSR